jgi:glucokinase
MSTAEPEIALAGDIGGTKTNLGLFRRTAARPELLIIDSYSSPAAKDLNEMIRDFVRKNPARIQSACFGIAGPALKGRCRVTNLEWEASEESVRQQFGWEKVRLINDLTAMAYSIAILEEDELYPLNEGQEEEDGPIGIVAPGTGLGVALAGRWEGKVFPIPSEGGHVDFAPRDNRQVELWKWLAETYGHVSVERVVSGPGIQSIYLWLRESERYREPEWLTEWMNQKDPSAAITEGALTEKEPLCVKALDLFVSVLGAVAGNLALTGMTTGGMYLGGGIPPRILPKLKDGSFIEAFLDKGRFRDVLARIPVRVILTNMAPLLGAAQRAFQ